MKYGRKFVYSFNCTTPTARQPVISLGALSRREKAEPTVNYTFSDVLDKSIAFHSFPSGLNLSDLSPIAASISQLSMFILRR